MPQNADPLRARTKRFAFDIIRLVKGLHPNIATEAIARQLIRAGTGVASNHRAAGRSRSKREFIARLGVVLEEADESEFWLEALVVCDGVLENATSSLRKEAGELRAIFWQSLRTARDADSKS
jgi:four helix bundle protein